MSTRFTTIVAHIENLELRKDTGQIPYQFQKILNGNSTLVSYYYSLNGGRKLGPVQNPPLNEVDISKDYPYMKSEVPGLRLHFLKYNGRGRFYEKEVYSHINYSRDFTSCLHIW